MLTKEEFITKYVVYSDDELLDVYYDIDNYSEEAKKALHFVISERGGVEKLSKGRQKNIILKQEIERINDAVLKLHTPGVGLSFLQKMITSEILSQQELNERIEQAYSMHASHRQDKEVNEKTVVMSIIGSCVAGIMGGIFFGLQLIYSRRIFAILLIGLAILCYGVIRLFIRKSYKNIAVLIATIIAIILSGLLGWLLYGIIGYQGIK